MGQKQASYNASGAIIAFYDTVDSPAPASATVLDITNAQWQTCLSNPGWTVVNGALVAPPPAPAPTLAQQAAALLAGTVTVTSTSTPTINGTYSITNLDQSHLQSEVLSIMLTGNFADGTQSIEWPDAATPSANHAMTIAQFKTFAIAIGAFVSACIKVVKGSATTLPSNQLSIP